MKKFYKSIISILLVLSISLSSFTTVFASVAVEDVLVSAGIDLQISEEYLTYAQLNNILVSLGEEGVTAESDSFASTARAVTVLQCLFSAFDVVVLPRLMYPEIKPPFAIMTSTEKDVWCTAKAYSFVTDTQSPILGISSENVANILYRLIVGDYTLTTPVLSLPILESVASASSQDALYCFVDAMLNYIPVKYQEMFIEDGWVVYLDEDYEYYKSVSETASGVCSYKNKYISARVNDRSLTKCLVTVCHEFGHYVAYSTGIKKDLDYLYELEAEAAVAVIRDYALTNSSEYFACFFETWMTDVNSHAKLEEVAPLTTALIRDALLGAESTINKELAASIFEAAARAC